MKKLHRLLGALLVVTPGCSFIDWDGDGHKGKVDCAPGNKAIHPGAGEKCDGAKVDEDCDGKVNDKDDDLRNPATFYADVDIDDFGDPEVTAEGCEAPEGFVADNTDCNDHQHDIHPGAVEVCDDNDVDEDCDGLPDDEDTEAEGRETRYADEDGDGYGDDTQPTLWCDPPRDVVEEGGDCDDADRDVNPDENELCDDDDVDEDCDGDADDMDPDGASGEKNWYVDADGDGYGDGARRSACDAEWNEVNNDDDCDDANDSVNPGETEICGDGVDQDCDDSAGACALDPDSETDDADATVTGMEEAAAMGWAAAGGTGDTNGDGLAEVWFTQPLYSGLGTGSGGAVGIQGRLGGTDDAASFGLVSTRSVDVPELGYSVATGADLSGDGRDDLVLGAPLTDLTWSEAGAVYVHAGPIADGATEEAAVAVRTGDGTDDHAGSSVAVGDWDGDGEADLFVAHSGGTILTGELGPLAPGTADATDSSDVQITATVGDVVATGDVDGDGQDELAVGDWGNSRVRVYAGGELGSVSTSDGIAVLDSDYSSIALGFATRIGADLDGDGYGDLVAGAPLLNSEAGRVEVLFGPFSGTITEGDLLIECPDAGDNFGYAVAAEGDIDGNGAIDLAIGAPLDNEGATSGGAVYVYDRLRSGSWSTSDANYVVTGAARYGWAGLSVAEADLDGDGTDDLVVGGYNWDEQTDAGVAWIFYGGGF